MALDLQGINIYPIVKTLTVYQTATEVLVPKSARVMQIGAQTHKLYWSSSGEDGVVLGAHKDFIAREAKQSIHLGRGRNRHDAIYISTQSASSATVTLVFSEE
tara:strand:- start:6426 stop:6734 length:309 start_codon:yes stop_codon:yes gene_type:complete